MFILFIVLSIDAATTVTTDIDKYQRILKIRDYPDNQLIQHFPEKIPENAKNVKFLYHPAFIQGGESFNLMFETDSITIDNYINNLASNYIWKGKIDDALKSNYAINENSFMYLGINHLPQDFDIYIITSENYNHGKLSLIAVNNNSNKVIFIAEKW